MRLALIGHVEHVTIGAVPSLPAPGDIVHFDDPAVIAGGGGGIAFFQLTCGDAEVHLFTAFGNDDAAATVREAVSATGATIHAATRDVPHTRDLVLVTGDGERTIFVIGEPLHPRGDDPLPWDVLASCDAAYFTGQDPRTLTAARDARLLVVTARRSQAIAESGVTADVIVGSATDARESSKLADYAHPPRALVMTEGGSGGHIETASGLAVFTAPPPPARIAGRYGAGDSFAAALTWYLARGLSIEDACARAAVHGAAVLAGVNPLDHQLPLT